MTDDMTTEPLAHELFDSERRDSPQTPFESLRAKRDEIASRTDVLIPLGSAYTEMGVCVKYRLLDRAETDEIAKNVRKQTKERNEFMYRVLVDTMLRACEGFYLKPNGLVADEDAEPLKDPRGEEHIKTYNQFAKEMRGEPFQSARAAVSYIFGDNEFAVGQHGLLLQRWFSNTGLEVDDELLEG